MLAARTDETPHVLQGVERTTGRERLHTRLYGSTRLEGNTDRNSCQKAGESVSEPSFHPSLLQSPLHCCCHVALCGGSSVLTSTYLIGGQALEKCANIGEARA